MSAQELISIATHLLGAVLAVFSRPLLSLVLLTNRTLVDVPPEKRVTVVEVIVVQQDPVPIIAI